MSECKNHMFIENSLETALYCQDKIKSSHFRVCSALVDKQNEANSSHGKQHVIQSKQNDFKAKTILSL